MTPDYDEIRERIAAARADHPTDAENREPVPETVEEINRRIFKAGDLPDLASRMFRY